MEKDIVDREKSDPKALELYDKGVKYGCSTFIIFTIDEVTTTYGYGELSDIGSWEHELIFKNK